jgi:hypothetical protein
MVRTRLCDLLGIDVPILGASMGPELMGLELAAAVKFAYIRITMFYFDLGGFTIGNDCHLIGRSGRLTVQTEAQAEERIS